MRKLIFLLLCIFVSGCTKNNMQVDKNTNQNLYANVNENGNILWANGQNEKFYMPESKSSIAFITQNEVIIYNKVDNPVIEHCVSFHREMAMVKICDENEALLFKNGILINSGFVNYHNVY